MVQVLCVFVVPGLGMGIKHFGAEGIFCSGVCVFGVVLFWVFWLLFRGYFVKG